MWGSGAAALFFVLGLSFFTDPVSNIIAVKAETALAEARRAQPATDDGKFLEIQSVLDQGRANTALLVADVMLRSRHILL